MYTTDISLPKKPWMQKKKKEEKNETRKAGKFEKHCKM